SELTERAMPYWVPSYDPTETPAGMDRRVVSIEDGVLLNYGPRTDQVLSSLVGQLYGNVK
ncbi:hypothetical protein ABZW02_37110, partial [Streptomyces sp. NPDC005180]